MTQREPLQSGPLAAMADDIDAYHLQAGIPLLAYATPEKAEEYRSMPNFFPVEKYASLRPAEDELGAIVEEVGSPVEVRPGVWRRNLVTRKRIFLLPEIAAWALS